MTDRSKISVLFLCTGNSCRSQMAEAMLRQLGGDRFEALSAGSHPAGFIHPLAIDAMRRLNIPLTSQTSKSWSQFASTHLDAVVTLCDAAASETCPVWPGGPMTAHWSIPDPAFHPGTDEERLEFALLIAERLRTKIAGLVGLDWAGDQAELKQRLGFLGEI
jgi:protein-tyrosine-phosphatase